MSKSKKSSKNWESDPVLRKIIFARRNAMADTLSLYMESSYYFAGWSHDQMLTAGMELAEAIINRFGDEPWLSAK